VLNLFIEFILFISYMIWRFWRLLLLRIKRTFPAYYGICMIVSNERRPFCFFYTALNKLMLITIKLQVDLKKFSGCWS